MPPPKKKARYEQSSDPTLTRFIPKKADVIGEAAMLAQIGGNKTTSTAVRVRAQSLSDTHMGQGLHEVAPTSLHPEISSIPNTKKRKREAAAEFQSGGRTTPALTPMNYGGRISGHTGTFVNLKKKGASTHTTGQAAAHEGLRQEHRAAVKSGLEGTEFAVHMINAQLQRLPTGQHLLQAPELTGAQPNLKQFGELEAPNAKKRANRIGFAQLVHEGREEMKARGRAAKRTLSPMAQKRTRSPSPERTPIDASGKGGSPISKPANSRVAPMPEFPTKHQTAHLSAWITQPLRK